MARRQRPTSPSVGDDLKTSFFTSRSRLGSVNIKIAGIPAPPPEKT